MVLQKSYLTIRQTQTQDVFDAVLNILYYELNRQMEEVPLDTKTEIVFTGNIKDCESLVRLKEMGRILFKAEEVKEEEEIIPE